MKGPAFTRGPWQAQQARTLIHVVGNRGIVSLSIAKPRHPETLAERERRIAEQWANARLIAAAPELYAALRAIRDFTVKHQSERDELERQAMEATGGNVGHLEALFLAAETALAKAEGAEG